MAPVMHHSCFVMQRVRTASMSKIQGPCSVFLITVDAMYTNIKINKKYHRTVLLNECACAGTL